MILTITPSPAIDWTIHVASFQFDAVNRITDGAREASGKGINVSWALHGAHVPTTALFPGGGETGSFMADELAAAQMPFIQVPTGHEVRTNITLVSPGHSTKINEQGAPLSLVQLDELTARSVDASRDARIALVCGSLPPRAPISYVHDLVAQLESPFVVVDASGDALAKALAAEPALIKPNVHELAELVGMELRTLHDVVAGARVAIDRGAGSVLASLGADGALFIDKEHALLATATAVPFVNSVGAGDALLAGFVAIDGDPGVRVKNAVLWASSAVAHPTTLFPVRHDFSEKIAVREVDHIDAPLSEPSLPLN